MFIFLFTSFSRNAFMLLKPSLPDFLLIKRIIYAFIIKFLLQNYYKINTKLTKYFYFLLQN